MSETKGSSTGEFCFRVYTLPRLNNNITMTALTSKKVLDPCFGDPHTHFEYNSTTATVVFRSLSCYARHNFTLYIISRFSRLGAWLAGGFVQSVLYSGSGPGSAYGDTHYPMRNRRRKDVRPTSNQPKFRQIHVDVVETTLSHWDICMGYDSLVHPD